jgi:hypothetical protein
MPTIAMRILTVYTLLLSLSKKAVKILMMILTISIASGMDQEGNNTSKTNRLKMEEIEDYNKMMVWMPGSKNIMIPFRILVNILVFMVWFKKRQRQAFMYHIIPL